MINIPSARSNPGAESASDHAGHGADIDTISDMNKLAKVIHHRLWIDVWNNIDGSFPPIRSSSQALAASVGPCTWTSGWWVMLYAWHATGSLSKAQSWLTLIPNLANAVAAWVHPLNPPEKSSPMDNGTSSGTSWSCLMATTAASGWLAKRRKSSTPAPSMMHSPFSAITCFHCGFDRTARTSVLRSSSRHSHCVRSLSMKTCLIWRPSSSTIWQLISTPASFMDTTSPSFSRKLLIFRQIQAYGRKHWLLAKFKSFFAESSKPKKFMGPIGRDLPISQHSTCLAKARTTRLSH